jgi:hypothetical protein
MELFSKQILPKLGAAITGVGTLFLSGCLSPSGNFSPWSDPNTPPTLNYANQTYALIAGAPIPPQNPLNNGGPISSCFSSSLPAGLSLSSSCILSGTPTTAQTANSYAITASNPWGSASTSISIGVTVGAISPSLSTINATPPTLTADGTTAATIIVTLKDANGNAVGGKSVTLNSTHPSETISPTSVLSSTSTGQATFTVVSTVSGQGVYTAVDTTDGITLSSTVSLSFIAGPVSPSVSTVTLSPNSIVADGASSSSVVVTVKDANGNPIQGQIVTLSSSGTPDTVSSPVTTTSQGIAGFLVTASTIVGSATLTASTGSSPVVNLGTSLTLNFTAGTPTQLVFATEPSANGSAGVPLPSQPVIHLLDSLGRLTSSTSSVILGLFSDSSCSNSTSNSTLSASQNPVSSVSGVASFSGVQISGPQILLYLGASSGGLSACSNQIQIHQWTAEDGVSGGSTTGLALALDASGDTYVTGYTTAAIDQQIQHGAQDLFVTKYDPNGRRLWTIQDGNAAGIVEGNGVAVDTQGNIYVTGSTNVGLDSNSQHGADDLFISKYSEYKIGTAAQSGTTVTGSTAVGWTSSMIGSELFYSNGDNAGPITAVFNSTTLVVTNTLTEAAQNYAIVSHDWTIQDGGSGGTTLANGIALDPTAEIYVTGSTSVGLDGNTLTGVNDLFITKYSPIGTRQWTVEDGTSGGQTRGNGIVLDSTGSIGVTGNTNIAIDGQTLHGAEDLFVTRYTDYRTGTASQFVDTITGVGTSWSTSMVGSEFVFANGVSAGTITAVGAPTSLTVNSTAATVTASNYSIIGRSWTVEDGATSGITVGQAIATDSSNNLYITGKTSKAIDGQTLLGSQDFFISEYSPTGNHFWTMEDGTSGGIASATGIAVSSVGNVFVTGTTANQGIDGQTLRGNQDVFVTQYSHTGSSATHILTIEDGNLNASVSSNGIALDSSNLSYCTGSTSGAAIDNQTLAGSEDLFVSKF